nr:site-specific integrase [Ramlibacter monticola]
MKFVKFTKKDEEALQASLARCDNPLFPLLVEAAISTLARRESLLRLREEDVDLDARTAHLRSKTGDVVIHLSHRGVEILRRVPVSEDGRYFPMTPSAVDNAWDAARARAGLPHLTFQDLRHIGATYYVRKGITAHVLQQLLGHKSPRQAQVYVNLVGKDVLEALDRAESSATQRGDLPPPIQGSAKEEMNRRRAQRLNAVRADSRATDQAIQKAQETVDMLIRRMRLSPT